MKINKKQLSIVILLIITLGVTGCEKTLTALNLDLKTRNSMVTLNNPTKTSIDGLSYKLVIVEGRTFVATKVQGNYWTLAGPIDR
jgi:hypothetical protein